MIKRGAAVALPARQPGCHTFRATETTAHLATGGALASVARADEALRPDGGQGDGGRDEHIVI